MEGPGAATHKTATTAGTTAKAFGQLMCPVGWRRASGSEAMCGFNRKKEELGHDNEERRGRED